MKKITVSIGFLSILFANNLNFYTFTLKENYQEVLGGNVIDKDYSNFGDMYGIGVEYEKYIQNIILSFNGEYSSGQKIYKGAKQDGTSIKVRVNNSYLYNLNTAVNFNPYYIKIGYRFWNRGNSNAPGDYNEKYYWTYVAGGLNYRFFVNKMFIKTNIQYQYAFNPQLKIYLGNKPVISLGNTNGFMGKVDLGYSLSKNYTIGINYKYDFWHIHHSKPFILILNNQPTVIFEPESYTKNQYLGVYYQMKF